LLVNKRMQWMNKPFSLTIYVSCLLLNSQSACADSYINNYLLESSHYIESLSPDSSSDLSLNMWDSWVDNSEIRLSDNDLSSSKNQSYSLRFRFKNSGQKTAEDELLGLSSQRGHAERYQYHLILLRKIYLDIINVIELTQKRDLLQQQLNMAEIEVNAYTSQVSTKVFNPARLQKVDIDRERLRSLLHINKQSLNRSLLKLNASVSEQKIAQQFFNYQQWLISIDSIMAQLDTDIRLQNHPALQKLKLETNIARKQVLREKARKSAAVNFFEVEYDADKSSYGATIGIRIPIGNNSFDSVMKNNNYHQTQLNWDLKFQSIKESMTSSHFLLDEYYETYKQERALLGLFKKRLKRMRTSENPELILSLKKQIQQQLTMEHEIRVKILREYINLLFLSGNLAAPPLRNWIEKETPEIRG